MSAFHFQKLLLTKCNKSYGVRRGSAMNKKRPLKQAEKSMDLKKIEW